MEPTPAPVLLPGERAGAWVRANRWLLLYALLLVVVRPLPGVGAAAAQEGAWKAILRLGAWVSNAWSLDPAQTTWFWRLPTLLASLGFLLGFRRWAARFLQADVAQIALLVLGSSPLWLWHSLRLDLALGTAALVGGAWLCGLGGYLLQRGLAPELRPGEGAHWLLWAQGWLGLAVLVAGPGPLLLTLLVGAAFLTWERAWGQWRTLNPGWGMGILVTCGAAWFAAGGSLHLPLPSAAALGAALTRGATNLLLGAFPWVLLLPALGFYLRGSGALRASVPRFLLLAGLGAGLGLGMLAALPFLTLLLAGLLQPIAVEGVSPTRIRRIGGLLGVGLVVLTAGLLAMAFFQVSLPGFPPPLPALLAPLRLLAACALLGALSVCLRALEGEGQFLVRETALTLGLLYLIGGTWGLRRLETVWPARSIPVSEPNTP